MTEELKSGTPDYTMGFSEEYLEALRRFTAESSAGYLLPLLRPGFRLLDVGCGPGTVSVGLARAVAPGELHGLDMEASQIDIARTTAQAYSVDNATFHLGDAMNLPFENDFFDAVHFNTVLMHIPDTQRALTEAKRVLKPGGIIGCREMIVESCFTYPDFNGIIREAWRIFEDLLAADDGHPEMGKGLKGHLAEAGFTNIKTGISSLAFNTPSELAFISRIVNQWFLAPEIVEAAIKYGAATRELFDNIKAAYAKWRDHPGAMLGLVYGEAVAGKPVS